MDFECDGKLFGVRGPFSGILGSLPKGKFAFSQIGTCSGGVSPLGNPFYCSDIVQEAVLLFVF